MRAVTLLHNVLGCTLHDVAHCLVLCTVLCYAMFSVAHCSPLWTALSCTSLSRLHTAWCCTLLFAVHCSWLHDVLAALLLNTNCSRLHIAFGYTMPQNTTKHNITTRIYTYYAILMSACVLGHGHGCVHGSRRLNSRPSFL